MTRRFRSFAWSGYIAGMNVGFGCASFAWLNPYLSLSLVLGGHALLVTALLAARQTSERAPALATKIDLPKDQSGGGRG